MATTVVWFRNDLRLADNPALSAAAARGDVVPVFVWSPDEEGDWPPGAASRWWLHGSLRALAAGLHRHRSRLVIRTGPTLEALSALASETGADAVYWNRRYEPAAVARDRMLKSQLPGARSHAGSLLREPWALETRAGGPYKVFTPFWRALRAAGAPDPPLPEPRLHAPAVWPASLELDRLELLPRIGWDAGIERTWTPGERAAAERLESFSEHVERYPHERDMPSLDTSRMSPHLHFGELSPRQVWHAVDGRGAEPYLRQLGWRDFAHHLLFHFPETATEPLQPAYRRMPWRDDADGLRAWQRGETGYPLVDAGMRQLWETGWMHNRVRMVAASFLTKHLLIHWHRGRALVLGHAGGRRPGQQHAGLAVGGRQRSRCGAVSPHLQPDRTGAAVRPRPHLRGALAGRPQQPADRRARGRPPPRAGRLCARAHVLIGLDRVRLPGRRERKPCPDPGRLVGVGAPRRGQLAHDRESHPPQPGRRR